MRTVSHNMKTFIPIRGSDFTEDYPSYESFLNEIVNLSRNEKLITLLDDVLTPRLNERPLISSLKFEIATGSKFENNEPEFATELNKKHPFFYTEYISEYLTLSLEFKKDFSIDDYDYCTFIINKILFRLNFLINLSYASNVDFLIGVIYTESNIYIGKTQIIASNNMYAYEHTRKMGWPKIKNVKLLDTVNWFHKFKIHTNNKSENNLHRAINALSYLFGDFKREYSADLFWVMLGIESLLVKGNQNITSQFKEKSILILGKPKEYSKKLAKLYDYRSRLIHGNFDIFPKYYSDYESFRSEYSDYLDFAISILLALIRELIEKQECGFEFELKLKE